MSEKKLQETYIWERTNQYSSYGELLGQYQAVSVLENCREKGKLLDLACGDGFITQILSKHFLSVVGVDASGTHLAKAKSKCPDVRFIESLIEDLEVDEKFDCVTMLNVLEHVIDPCLTLKKAASHLDDDGILIVHVPNSQAVNRKIAVLMGTLLSCEELSPFDIDVAGHRRYYDMDALKTDVENAGLEIVSTGGVFYKMLSTPQMDWFLKNGLWDSGFGWGRVGSEEKNWRNEFCKACYLYGKEHPTDSNIVYVVAKNKQG